MNTIIFFGILYYQGGKENNRMHGSSYEDFTRSFQKYLQVDNDKLFVSSSGEEALTQLGAWLQILDKNGNVIKSYQAPKGVPDHYSPFELIHKYKYMDDELNTYFVGEYKGYSYLVAVPDSKERRYVFMINEQNMLLDISHFLGVIFIVNLVISTAIGFLFSAILTKPVDYMIERIHSLKERVFESEKPKRPGIYKHVFANLNEVANTLKDYEQKRQKLEEMRNEWISNVSHDIKTPLSSIRGYAELLRSEELSDAERLEYTEVIERQSLYMRELLDDFNLTMRLRNQELPLHKQQTNMEHFVRELIIDLLNDPQFNSGDIQYDSTTTALYWNIDQHLIKRALLNFIYNALLHNEDNVEVNVLVTDNSIVIKDNGNGIPEEEQGLIFERYYRGTNTSNIHGTGLGMAISRDIIEAHEGSVQLTSEEGKGTTIEIRMKN